MNKLVTNAGKLIRFKRKVKGYSTQELAKKLNVSSGLINNIENSKSDTFNLELLYNLSSCLDLSVIDIISYNIDIIIEPDNTASPFEPLLKALTMISNNKDWNYDKTKLLADKLIDEINYFSKLSSD